MVIGSPELYSKRDFTLCVKTDITARHNSGFSRSRPFRVRWVRSNGADTDIKGAACKTWQGGKAPPAGGARTHGEGLESAITSCLGSTTVWTPSQNQLATCPLTWLSMTLGRVVLSITLPIISDGTVYHWPKFCRRKSSCKRQHCFHAWIHWTLKQTKTRQKVYADSIIRLCSDSKTHSHCEQPNHGIKIGQQTFALLNPNFKFH